MQKEIIVYKDCGFEFKVNGKIVYSEFKKDKNDRTERYKLSDYDFPYIYNMLLFSDLNSPMFDIKINTAEEGFDHKRISVFINYQDKNFIKDSSRSSTFIMGLKKDCFEIRSVNCPEIRSSENTFFVLGTDSNSKSDKNVYIKNEDYNRLVRTIEYLNNTPLSEVIFNELQFNLYSW